MMIFRMLVVNYKRGVENAKFRRLVFLLIAISLSSSIGYALIRGVFPADVENITVARTPDCVQVLRHDNEFVFFIGYTLSTKNLNRTSGGHLLAGATEIHVIFAKNNELPKHFGAGHFAMDDVSPIIHPNLSDVLRIKGDYYVLVYKGVEENSGSLHKWKRGSLYKLSDSEISSLFSLLGKKRIAFAGFNGSAFRTLVDDGWQGNMHAYINGLVHSHVIGIEWPDGLRQDFRRQTVDGVDSVFLTTHFKDGKKTEVRLMPYGKSRVEVPASLFKR